jgi:hypothetical protein
VVEGFVRAAHWSSEEQNRDALFDVWAKSGIPAARFRADFEGASLKARGGRTFRCDRGQILRRVVLPAAVPPILAGVRYGLTHAWLGLVAVELLASSEGLGYLPVWGRQMFWLDTVIVAMAVIGLIGLAMDRSLGAVEARLQRWRADGQVEERA